MKVTVYFKDDSREYEVPKKQTVADVLQIARNEIEIPASPIIRVDGIAMADDYELEDGTTIKTRLAEAMYGANDIDISEYVGKKVGVVINECGEFLNLPAGEKIIARLNGKKIWLSRKIKKGDRIEFIKKAGKKL